MKACFDCTSASCIGGNSPQSNPSLAFKMALPFLLMPRFLRGSVSCKEEKYKRLSRKVCFDKFSRLDEQKTKVSKPFESGVCWSLRANSPDLPNSHPFEPTNPVNFPIHRQNSIKENDFLLTLQMELNSHYNRWNAETDRLQRSGKLITTTPGTFKKSKAQQLVGSPSTSSYVNIKKLAVYVDFREFSQKAMKSVRVMIVSEVLGSSYVIAEIFEENKQKHCTKTFRQKFILKKNADLKGITAQLNDKKIMKIEVFKKDFHSHL